MSSSQADDSESTTQRDNSDTTAQGRWWQRRWLRWVTAGLLILALVLVLVPIGARHALERWLLDNGADSAQVADVDINPFLGVAELDGLDVRIDGRTVLSDATIHLDLDWLALWSKGIVLEGATLRGVTVDIEQLAGNRWRIGSLVIGGEDSSPPTIDEEIERQLAWWLGLDRVELVESSIHFKGLGIDATLWLDDLRLANFHSRPEQIDAALRVAARFNEAPLRLDLAIAQLHPVMRVDGTLAIDALALDQLAGLGGELLDSLAGRFDLDGKLSLMTTADGELEATYTGATRLVQSVITTQTIEAGVDLSWDGSARFASGPAGGKQGLALDGRLETTGLRFTSADGTLRTAAESMDWQGRLDYARGANGTPNLRLDGRLGGTAFDVEHDAGGLALQAGRATWEGAIDLTAAAGNEQTLLVAGGLDGEGLTLELSEQELGVRLDTVTMKPDVQLIRGEAGFGLAGSAALEAGNAQVTDTGRQLILLELVDLAIDGARAVSLQQYAVDSLVLTDARLVRAETGTEPAVRIGETRVTGLAWSRDNGLNLDRLALTRLEGKVARQADGSMDLANALQAGPPAADTEAATEAAAEGVEPAAAPATDAPGDTAGAGVPAIRIGELSISDDSEFHFRDESVSPAFNGALNITKLQVSEIDSRRPETPIELRLESKIDNYASLAVDGKLRPFASPLGIDLEVDLRDYNMVGISPYMIKATGYLVKAGQLDVDSKILIDQGAIDAGNKLTISKLRLEEASADVIKQGAGSIGMPLDAALGMLRDKNDNIELEVPIQGKLDEVQFGTGDIINTALKKATTTGMKTYLVYAFQPYGAMIAAGQLIANQAGKIRLDPVFFDAGQATLNSEQQDYLKKLATVMQERPQIEVQLCGFVTRADLPSTTKPADEKNDESEAVAQALIDAAITLGHTRAKGIKDYLIGTHAIDGGRLILCAPEYDSAMDARPRVELLI